MHTSNSQQFGAQLVSVQLNSEIADRGLLLSNYIVLIVILFVNWNFKKKPIFIVFDTTESSSFLRNVCGSNFSNRSRSVFCICNDYVKYARKHKQDQRTIQLYFFLQLNQQYNNTHLSYNYSFKAILISNNQIINNDEHFVKWCVL